MVVSSAPRYILEMLLAFQVENEVWLVLEHADGGDLFGSSVSIA